MTTSELQSVILPSTDDEAGFVELAKTSKGKLYRKQVLHMGREFVHPNVPGKKIKVDKELADSLVRNFNDGIGDIVQVPIVDGKNRHTEDPTRNIGQVVDIEYDDKGVYAIVDDRRSADKVKEQGELGKTLIGASALIHMDYENTSNGKKVGPTLLHMAVTNRPYITDLEDYQEIVAASADSLGVEEPEVLSPAQDTEDQDMDLDGLLATLKDEHGIDVADLQARAEGPKQEELVSALSNVLREAGAEGLKTSEDEITLSDVAQAVVELAGEKLELSNKVEALVADADALRQKSAESEVDSLVRDGKVLPKQRDAMIQLAMSNRETFLALIPDSALVSLSEDGVTYHEEPGAPDQFEKHVAEVDRLVALAQPEKK